MGVSEESFIYDYALMDFWVNDDISVDQHRHGNIEVLYLLKGNLTCYYNAPEPEKAELYFGDFLVIPPLTYHRLTTEPGSLYIRMHINQKLARNYISITSFGSRPIRFERSSFEAGRLLKYLNRIVNMYADNDPGMRLLQQGQFYEFLYYLEMFCRQKRSDAGETGLLGDHDANVDDSRVVQINNFILANYTLPIQLQDLADELHLSRVYLSKYFKKQFGIGFIKYLTDFRLQQAAKDLAGYRDRGIARIAMDNGFPNLTAFNTAFKKKYNITPTGYRKKLSEVKDSSPSAEPIRREVLQYMSVLRQDEKEASVQVVTIHTSVKATEYEKYTPCWNRIINFGPISDLLLEKNQLQLLAVVKDLHISFVRIWNPYDVISYGKQKVSSYNFTRIDRAVDFLLNNGLKPYFVIGKKPLLILRKPDDPVVEETPGTQYSTTEFVQYFQKLLAHYTEKYGSDTVSQWGFEFWYNFRSKSPTKEADALAQLHQARLLLDQYCPGAQLGGFGEAFENWSSMIEKADPDLDYYTLYDYGNVLSADTYDHVVDDIHKLQHQSKKPVRITEWSLLLSSRDPINDSVLNAAYIVKNAISMIGETDSIAYWLASDLFAEYEDTNKELFGGNGLITINDIYKPSFYAFLFLKHLEPYIISRNDYSIITTNGKGNYTILCHNYKAPLMRYGKSSTDSRLRDANSGNAEDIGLLFENNDPLTLSFELKDVKPGKYTIRSSYVNRLHGSVQDEIIRLKEENPISSDDLHYLRCICIPAIDVTSQVIRGSVLTVTARVEANEIRCIQIRAKTE